MKKILALLLSIVGYSSAAHLSDNDIKLQQIANIDQNTPIILEHAKDYVKQNKEHVELAYHYSHRSHYSHYSHRSHYSHYSSY